ncbi:MAG TPA: glycosyltransferase [Cyclobacteriaceae bacterium]|nr:glycosyltransferase [Cyclobacteriaceae bacterium]
MQVLFIVFLVAVGIQLIYITVFLIAILKKESGVGSETQPVSVIVCAHDEEQNLRELVPILLQQKHPAFEIIIVNDRSNDGTYDFLLEETKKVETHNNASLRMVHAAAVPAHVNGKKFGITLGIKAAKYDWIVLTDADCRPNSDQWLQSISAQCTGDKEIILGYSSYQKEDGLLNLFIRFETLLTAIQYVSYAILGNPYMGVGRNLAYRKSLFLNNKGFNGFLGVTGGDDDLFVNQHAHAKNTAVTLGEESIIYSVPKRTLQEFFNQKVRHLSVGKKYRFKHKLLLGVFSLTQLITWLLGLPLLFIFSGYLWVLGAFITRILLLSITTYQAARRFGHKFESWSVPLLDFLFVIYYLSTAPVALLTKKIRWRN